MKSATRLILVVLLAGVTAGCSCWLTETDSRSGVSSSLVDYLYPRGEVPPPPDKPIPRLELPIRVGLAFVPGSGART